MNIYMNVQFRTRNVPKGYHGVTSENWNIGKEVPMSCPALIKALAIQLAEFYYATGLLDVDGVNSAMDTVGRDLIALSGKFAGRVDES